MQGKNRQELIVANKCTRSLRSQSNYLKKNWEALYQRVFDWYFSQYWRKDIEWVNKFLNLDDFREKMWVYSMIESIKGNVRRVIDMWYKINYRTFRKPLEENAIDFNLQNQRSLQYMREFTELHLSDYKGSISLTTKNAVIEKLRYWIENNLSYWEVAKEIEKLDNLIFSRTRAKLIATREIGKAYEYGNYIPMLQAHNAWLTVEKHWLSTRDEKVTFECSENDRLWFVHFKHVYIYDNDDIAVRSWNPNCRCSMERKIK